MSNFYIILILNPKKKALITFSPENVLQVCVGNILSGDLELPRHDKKFNWATFNELHNLLPHKKED